MLGAFGEVQVDALTRVGSPRRRGTVVDCYLAQQSREGIGANGVPGSRRSCIWSRSACSSSTVSKAGAPSCAWRCCWNGGRNFRTLGPCHDRGRLTSSWDAKLGDADDHARRAETWAHEIWRTWAHEQPRIRNLDIKLR